MSQIRPRDWICDGTSDIGVVTNGLDGCAHHLFGLSGGETNTEVRVVLQEAVEEVAGVTDLVRDLCDSATDDARMLVLD